MSNSRNLAFQEEAVCPLCDNGELHVVATRHNMSVLVCSTCGFHSGLTNDAVAENGAVSTAPEHFQMLVDADSEWKVVMEAMLDRRLDFLRQKYGAQPQRWLEIGPGNGAMGELVKRRGGHWLGVEIDTTMAKGMQDAGKNVILADFSDVNVEQLLNSDPQTQQGFDIIFFSQVLEHVKRPQAFLRNACMCLKPGGIIYIDVPNNDGMTALIRKLNRRSNGYGEIVPPHHMMAYGRKTLANALKEAGFENIMAFARSYRDPTFGLVHARMDNRLKMKAIWTLTKAPGWGGNLVGIAVKPKSL